MWPVQVADNNINKQQTFYSPPKRYNKIRRLKESPFVGNFDTCYPLNLHWPATYWNLDHITFKVWQKIRNLEQLMLINIWIFHRIGNMC